MRERNRKEIIYRWYARINYADERYRKTQKFNSKMAKKHGADKVIEYTEHDLSEEFKEKIKKYLDIAEGGGY